MNDTEDTLESKPTAPSAPYVLLGCGWMVMGVIFGIIAGIIYEIMGVGGWKRWNYYINSDMRHGLYTGTVGDVTKSYTEICAFYGAIGGAVIGLIIGLMIAYRRRNH